ncbi:MAG: hypothetical protein JWO05_3187 [Gemmatimonadetes bacterium]|nr:hypothetical protein [Gemmatimonadota bacterium]
MRRLIFAVALTACWTLPAVAQETPGRDLLMFPVGAMAEPQSVAGALGGGFWNPATVAPDPAFRLRIGVSALNTPIDQGVSAQILAASGSVGRGWGVGITVARAAIIDLVRTESDPQTIGNEIAYNTTVYSIAAARRWRGAAIGVSLRARNGQADQVHRSDVALDAGLLIARTLGTPVRLAMSTFLLSPQGSAREAAEYFASADLPLLRRDSTLLLRGGVAASHLDRRGGEVFPFATLDYRQLSLNGGLSRSSDHGVATMRARLGFGLRYARYTVGVAREESGTGLGASYQFLLTSVFR